MEIRELRVRAVGRREFLRLTGSGLAAALAGACYGEAPALDSTAAPAVTPGVPEPPDRGLEPEPAWLPADEVPVPRPVEPIDLDCAAGGPAPWPEEIPPITSNEDFYVVAYLGVADVDAATWKCPIRVLGEEVAALTYDWLESQERKEKLHTLQCIESRPGDMRMSNALWEGLPLSEVLDLLGVAIPEEAGGIGFKGADGYMTGLPVTDLQKPIWLVWRMNGEPLPAVHGFPARMLVPARFGWKNVKQLVRIDFTEGDPSPEYQKAWATAYGIQGLVAWPTDMALIEGCRKVRILGKAFAGSDPIVWVGLTTDGGETWQDCELTYQGMTDVWTLWRFDWTPPGAGTYVLRVACRSKGGKETNPTEDPYAIPFSGGMSIEVEVA